MAVCRQHHLWHPLFLDGKNACVRTGRCLLFRIALRILDTYSRVALIGRWNWFFLFLICLNIFFYWSFLWLTLLRGLMGMYYNHFRWADQIDGNIDELIVVAMEEHKKRTSRMQKKKNVSAKRRDKFYSVWLWCLSCCVSLEACFVWQNCSMCKG